jgi:hypothetical protein
MTETNFTPSPFSLPTQISSALLGERMTVEMRNSLEKEV